MRLFEKKPEAMTLEEANKAFTHLVRNMSVKQIREVENDPHPREGDDAFIAIRKRVARRIQSLKCDA